MNAPPDYPPSHTLPNQAGTPQNVPPLSSTKPLFVWLISQLATIAVFAIRIRLWAQAPEPTELLALRALLTVQIAVSSLLFPMLLANWRLMIAVAVCAWPFLMLAGLLAAASMQTVLLAGGYVTGWLVALWLVRLSLRSTRSRLTAVSFISLWVLSGPLLLFIRLEYGGTREEIGRFGKATLGPIVAMNHLLDLDFFSNVPLLLLALAGICLRMMMSRRKRHVRAQQVL